MAGGGIIRSEKEYPGKLTCKVFISCIIAAAGGLIFGYDLGISGTYVKSIFLFLFC